MRPSEVVVFGSARPVTCAVMDGAFRWVAAINHRRPGFAEIRTIEPDAPFRFVSEIVSVLKQDRIVHWELPIEGWGNAVLPGSALMLARLATRRGKIVLKLHEWTSLNRLRYLSTIPDLLAADAFFVSRQQKETFQKTPWVSRYGKESAPVITIGRTSCRPPSIRCASPWSVPERSARAIARRSRSGLFRRVVCQQAADLLLRTTAALHARGMKARLLVCGDFLWDKPKDRSAFLALADELGLTDWLDFRGRIDDEGELMAALSASDVFFLPYADGLSARRGSFQANRAAADPAGVDRAGARGRVRLFSAAAAQDRQSATVLAPIPASPGVCGGGAQGPCRAAGRCRRRSFRSLG